MAWDRKALKISFLFTEASQFEHAVTSVHVAGTSTSYDPTADLPSYTQTVANTLGAAMQALMANSNTNWMSYSTLTGVKIAALDQNGRYLTDANTYSVSGTGYTGTHSGLPPQCTICVTLWSGQHLGKGNFGRMYLPHCGFALAGAATGASTAVAAQVRTAAKTFLDAVNSTATAISAGTGLRIMSGVTTSKAVAQVGVGTLIDTQRRRERQLSENLAYVAL